MHFTNTVCKIQELTASSFKWGRKVEVKIYIAAACMDGGLLDTEKLLAQLLGVPGTKYSIMRQ
jgi:hypothetical protein